MVTIKEVAKSAKVSVATVSKVLNNRPQVSQETRTRVLKTIKKLGYFPNITARKLITKKTENIGFIISREVRDGMSNPFYSRVLYGVESELRHHGGYNLLFSVIPDEVKSENDFPKKIRENNVDGLLLISKMDDNFILKMREKEIPLVLVDYFITGGNLNCVISDNFWGTYRAVEYLISLGHKRIGLLSGPQNHPTIKERISGYKQALEDNKITSSCLSEEGNLRFSGGYQAMSRLMNHHPLPSAIFAVNDETAIGAMRAIKEKGLKIPEDISVVGFDDIEQSSHTDPPLTTVRVYKEDMGRAAVKKLLEIIERKEEISEKVVIPTKLVIRKSSRKL